MKKLQVKNIPCILTVRETLHLFQLDDPVSVYYKDQADPSLTQGLVGDFQLKVLCNSTFFEVSIEVSTIALSLLVFLRAPFHHKPYTCTAKQTYIHTPIPSHSPF